MTWAACSPSVPIRPEKNEPVFHARWEGRIAAIWSALGAWRKWNSDFGRQTRESIPRREYLALDYFQLRYVQTVELLVASGHDHARRARKRAAGDGTQKAVPPLTAEESPRGSRMATRSDAPSTSRRSSASGQRVRARNINPETHTRLPRYVRGKSGAVERDHGVFVFPDTNAQGQGEKPQHVYSVRFIARELWGDQANPKDTVVVNLWDDYLDAM